MSVGPDLPSDETFDLTSCDREPIHVPGSVQPHGVLIATHLSATRISHVSANLLASTGLAPERVLNAELADVLGLSAFETIEAQLLDSPPGYASMLTLDLPLPIRPRRNVMVHRYLGRTIVELEAPAEHERPLAAIAQRIIASLSATPTVERLCEVAARTVRSLTGYDRVMVYRFHADGHGAVVSEARSEDLEPFLDLHYPASDIPMQARRLYVLQRMRTIQDVHYTPVAVVASDGDTSELDMTFCGSRAVSPIHLQYLRNMGVRATMAISLLRENEIREDELWGMIVCHHRQPMAPDAHLRELCALIGQLMSVLLHRASDTETLTDRLRRHDVVVGLEADLAGAESVATTLTRRGEALLALMGAGGAVINIGGRGATIGATPPLARALDLIGSLRRTPGDAIVAVDEAGVPGGVADDCPETASGILMMPIPSAPNDVIAWFRPERRQTVRWGGDPQKPMVRAPGEETLTPRTSFAAWTEIVRGRSEPWTANDMEVAEELRRTVTGALLSHAEAQLALLSAYDPLTTLANRRTLKLTMDRVAADPAHKVAAMLFLDLDRFKAINDVLGHSAGDQVLIEVAARLRRLTPEGALAGRLGGDEFVIFWPGAGKSEAERLAQQLMSAMGKPFVLSDQTLHVSGSIGISWSDFGGLDRLMPQADEAMYAAKRHGGGGVAMFHPVFHAEALNNLRLEQDLFRALNDDEITVHYQPIFRASDRSLLGFEALARWLHPERGWISPVDFIPVAEKSGLITRLGERVMTCAVRQISEWLRIDATLRMTVNVSGLQLVDRGLGDMLSNLLQLEAVPPERVCVEVTETVLMKESALDQLHRLREMGVGIAMDDFGTGYSSIAYLEDLPVDLVKIDRRFVEPLGSSARADGVFQAIVSLARTLGLSLIAEGCETEDQLRVIRESGCDGVQGWLLGKAAPPEEVAERLLGDRKGD